MPNHLHVLVEPLAEYRLGTILHSWKSFTANKANKILGRAGEFWQPESFDRAVRDEDHLWRLLEYIHQNPVVSGLVEYAKEWPWSSAHRY